MKNLNDKGGCIPCVYTSQIIIKVCLKFLQRVPTKFIYFQSLTSFNRQLLQEGKRGGNLKNSEYR